MLSKKMLKALNDQVNAELYSHYLYLAMAAHCEAENLSGFAHWLKAQSYEEYGHGLKIFGYIQQRGSRVSLKAIDEPPAKWASPLAVVEDVAKHERLVTSKVNDLVDLAIAEKDHATLAFLQWFVTEQVEEEATADALVQKLKLVRDAPSGLFMVDRELAARQ